MADGLNIWIVGSDQMHTVLADDHGKLILVEDKVEELVVTCPH